MGKLCAQVGGYNLQAATRIAANDRDGLERMAVRGPTSHRHRPLLWRVFLGDVLQCTQGRGGMRIVAAVTSGAEATRILRNLGLPDVAPAFHGPRPPPQN